MAGVVPGKHRKQYWFWKRLKKPCVRWHWSTFKSYNQGRYIFRHMAIRVTEETLSYRRFTLAKLPNSQCQRTDCIYSPSVHSSIFQLMNTYFWDVDRDIISTQFTLRRITTHFSRITTCGICSANVYFARIKSIRIKHAEKELKCQYAFCNSTSKHICLE